MTDVTALRDRLLSILRAESVRTGEFTLASGKKSDFYVDGKKTTLHAEGAYGVGRLMFEQLRGRGIGAVGGLTLGADPIATAISVVSHLEGEPMQAFIVRKQSKGHGTTRQIEGYLPTDGTPVAIVEDTTTTGGSALQAVEAAREAGANVVTVITLVDRQEGGEANIRAANVEFETIFRREEVLEKPAG